MPSRNAEPQTREEAEKILEARFGGKLKQVDWSKIKPAVIALKGPTMSQLNIEDPRMRSFDRYLNSVALVTLVRRA